MVVTLLIHTVYNIYFLPYTSHHKFSFSLQIVEYVYRLLLRGCEFCCTTICRGINYLLL